MAGILAGRQVGVSLDEVGRAQAVRAGERLAGVRVVEIVSSPLERCRQTAAAIAAAQPERPHRRTDRGINECDYGEWQGRALKTLAKEPLWRTVQDQPSGAAFPGGESLSAMQARAVAAIRRRDALIEGEHGPGAVWVAVSHGDIIKSLLADALGMHLDLFQRLHVDPASVSIVRYTGARPVVLGLNTHAGELAWLTPPQGKKGRPGAHAKAGDAPVGGGAGPGSTSR